MGSRFESNVNKKEVRPCRKRSKGERLGWADKGSVVSVSLRSVSLKGEVVSSSYCYMSCSFKLIP